MGWKLELVEIGSHSLRIEVASLGEIIAPASVDEVGLDHDTAQRMLGDIRRAVVALQEAALQTEAARLRRLDPTLRLKDYRLRTIQSLHGALTIHMPRLARKIGRASCRERVCQSVYISVVAGSLKNKKQRPHETQ